MDWDLSRFGDLARSSDVDVVKLEAKPHTLDQRWVVDLKTRSDSEGLTLELIYGLLSHRRELVFWADVGYLDDVVNDCGNSPVI